MRALESESAYARYLLPKPILGYSADEHIEQFRHVANRRARQLGMDEPFPGAENVLPWLDEQADLRKEKNFFETRVTEYQSGGLRWWVGPQLSSITGTAPRSSSACQLLMYLAAMVRSACEAHWYRGLC